MSVSEHKNKHRTLDFPEDLMSIFETKDVTDNIAANFQGVTIIKDTVSRILHVFGPSEKTVDDAVHAVRTFISEVCIQQIMADASLSDTKPPNLLPSSSNSGPNSGISVDENDQNAITGLKIQLRDIAVDITENEVLENLNWIKANKIVCQKNEESNFLTGVIYVSFHTNSDFKTAQEKLSLFFPNYEVDTITKATWNQEVTNVEKKNAKRFSVSDSNRLDRYLSCHKSDDGADRERLKEDARHRQNLLLGMDASHNDNQLKGFNFQSSIGAAGSSRRPASPVNYTGKRYNYNNSNNYAKPPERSLLSIDDYSDNGSSRNIIKPLSSSSSRLPYNHRSIPSEIVGNPSVQNKRLRPIAIDANNVCMTHGNHQVYSCVGLEKAVQYFLDRGHTNVFAFIPEIKIRRPANSQTPRVDRQDILQKLESEGRLTVIPRKKRTDGSKLNPYDDVMIVQYAYECQGVIISNDNMLDVAAENPHYKTFIEERRITFCFAGDHFMLITDTNGPSGPRADEMLSFSC